MVAAAVIGSAVVGIGSSVVQSNAAGKAAKQQANAQNNATAAQQGMFNETQENLQPFIQQGNQAASKVSQLEGLAGSDPAGIQNTLNTLPGYQFANYQGLKSVQNSATARGLGVSGAAQKGAADYSTGLANQYYNNLLGGLQNTETTGANAAGGLATTSATVGGNIANTITGAGNAQAAGTLGPANALASGGQNGLQNAFYASKILGQENNGLYGDAYTPAAGFNQAGLQTGFGDLANTYSGF